MRPYFTTASASDALLEWRIAMPFQFSPAKEGPRTPPPPPFAFRLLPMENMTAAEDSSSRGKGAEEGGTGKQGNCSRSAVVATAGWFGRRDIP